ncbi:MAG: serine--tRNA ligase [Verrucomicrobiota bacterium]|nr:serine--tRNA ligase [Verrucomicrobiota bacterium]
MIDIKLLRESPELVRTAIAKKKFKDIDIDAVLALDTERRTVIAEAEVLRASQNAANSDMAKMPKGSPEFIEKVKEMKTLSGQVKELQAKQTEIEEKFQAAFLTIPNLPHESVPVGRTEEENIVFSTWGDPASASPAAKPHWELPFFANSVDLARGVKVTGAGFPFYVGDVARLVRSLLQFFLDEDSAAGYTEVMPPIMVNAASATATGQLPDKEGQMYFSPVDGFYMIPTAEVPVTNLYRDEIIDHKALPLKHCAYTPCFRREAGSWGSHVRGLNRLHQFDKVEIVKWTHPDTSFDELESLRGDAERLLQKLELPYRTLLMCTGDIGFAHAKQYDLEVFAAGQKRWLEVSSCSCFTDFQARRANTRFRDADGKVRFVHTLNGSALAIPRVLAAILENYLQADGRVKIPSVLVSRMGKEYIGG